MTLELWLKKLFQGWRDGSVVKSVCCAFRGLDFSSEHPQPSSSQSPVTSAVGDLKSFAGLSGHLHSCVHTSTLIYIQTEQNPILQDWVCSSVALCKVLGSVSRAAKPKPDSKT